MEVLERVRFARILAGFTTELLASRLNLTRVNVVRWEAKLKGLPAKQVHQLAKETGFPEGFFYGENLKGLVIARPGRFFSKNTIGRAYEYVRKQLPLFVAGAECTVVESDHRAATLFKTDDYCMVVIPAGNLTFAIDECFNSTRVTGKEIEDAFECDDGVKVLLKVAGYEHFALERKKRTKVSISIETDDERSAVDIIMAAVTSLRRAGHEPRIVEMTTCDG